MVFVTKVDFLDVGMFLDKLSKIAQNMPKNIEHLPERDPYGSVWTRIDPDGSVCSLGTFSNGSRVLHLKNIEQRLV